jgi:hypothetical protein
MARIFVVTVCLPNPRKQLRQPRNDPRTRPSLRKQKYSTSIQSEVASELQLVVGVDPESSSLFQLELHEGVGSFTDQISQGFALGQSLSRVEPMLESILIASWGA